MKPALVLIPYLITMSTLARAAEPSFTRDIPADLAREAKITEEAALTTARTAVPHGNVLSIELEREKQQLIYSVDLRVPGKPGVEEIHVSALDGKLLSRHHESPRAERKEAAAEKNELTKKPPQ